MPGTLPTRRTTIRSRLFPVRTFTALLIVMLSRLTPFTSTSLSPTHRPAFSVRTSQHTQIFVTCGSVCPPPMAAGGGPIGSLPVSRA
uniref:Uncharacterized protein n=1 Tax=Scleropages formosus TaxID=113540 RepID=A0A8C9RQY9_SCLFO